MSGADPRSPRSDSGASLLRLVRLIPLLLVLVLCLEQHDGYAAAVRAVVACSGAYRSHHHLRCTEMSKQMVGAGCWLPAGRLHGSTLF